MPYSGLDDVALRFVAATRIFTKQTHNLRWVKQKAQPIDGLSLQPELFAVTKAGEALGFLRGVISTSRVDAQNDSFSPSAIDSHWFTLQYKRQTQKADVFKDNHTGEGISGRILLDSWANYESINGELVYVRRAFFYLANEGDRRDAAEGNLKGFSVAGLAFKKAE